MAIHYLRCGLSVFPLIDGGKRPAGPWEPYQTRRATPAEAAGWPAGNIGIVTGEFSGVVVVDCESEENAHWFLRHRATGMSPGIATTPRGVHLYFQHPGQRVKNDTHIKDEQGISRYDVRGDGGYVVAPPSKVSDTLPDVSVSGEYRWIREFFDPKKLPLFRMEWRPDTKPLPQPNTGRAPAPIDADRRIRDGAAYIQHIHAVSGQGGHNETFRAVCRLRDSGMDETEAYAVISDWNETNAHPCWSPKELLHKVKSVYSKG